MLNIKDTQRDFLIKNLPNSQQHIDSGDIDQLLEDLDDKITEIGFDAEYELNAVGLQLQKLYDEIYDQN